MKCKQCGEEMVLEESHTAFMYNNVICLCEQFGCVNCDITAIKRTYYKKVDEEEDYGN